MEYSDSDSEPEEVGRHGRPKGAEKKSEIARLKAIRKELAEVPFEELHKLQEKVGSKVYHKALFGRGQQSSEDSGTEPKQFKRANKNRPQEVSSKKPVSRFWDVVHVKKQMARDPRFDDLSGNFLEEAFSKNYKFLEDVKAREKQELEKELTRTKDANKKLKIQRLLLKMEQQERTRNKKQTSKELEKKYMRKEKELVKQGKKPFFLKKSDKKKLELAEKFKALKKSGKLDKYVARKRKKNAQKDRRKLPSAMSDGDS